MRSTPGLMVVWRVPRCHGAKLQSRRREMLRHETAKRVLFGLTNTRWRQEDACAEGGCVNDMVTCIVVALIRCHLDVRFRSDTKTQRILKRPTLTSVGC